MNPTAITTVLLVLSMFALTNRSWSQQVPEQDNAIQAQAIFVRGLTQAYIGNHDVAVSLFLRSLRFDVDNADVLVELSKSYAALEDLESAVYYAESASSKSELKNVKVHLAGLYDEIGRPADAINIMEGLVELSPENPRYRMTLVRYLIRDLQYTHAAERLIALPVQVTFDSPVVYGIATELFTRSSALGELNQLIALLEKQDAVALPVVLAMSDVLADQGRNTEAAELLEDLRSIPEAEISVSERLARLDSSRNSTVASTGTASTSDLVDRARSLIESGNMANFKEAEDILEHANSTDPTIETSMLLGDLNYKSGQFDEAARYYQNVLQTEVRIREIWQKSAGALLRADKTSEAIEVASDGLLFFPDDAGLLEILAFASFGSGSDKLSRETFTRAIENAGQDEQRIAIYWMALGNISIRLSELERALTELQTAQLFDPANSAILARLGSLNSMLGDTELGLEQVNLALVRNPASPDILHATALAYYSSGQFDEAREFVTTIFEYRSTIDDLDLAGDIYFALNRPEDARTFWTQALERDSARIDLLEKVQLLAQ